MRIGCGSARSCAAFVLRYVRSYSSYLGEFIGLVKRTAGNVGSRGIEISRRCVGALVTKLKGIKRSSGNKEGREELKGTELGAVSEEDVTKMNRLLTFIAQGGLYATLIAFLGISMASLYAGWMGMAVITLVIGVALFLFGGRKLKSIINPDEKKPKTDWKAVLLGLGFFFVAIALMALIDLAVGDQIPRPSHDPYWWLEGIIGLVLLVIAFSLFRVKQKQQ